MSKARVLLVDGHGLAYRAFYALPELSAPDGTPTQVLVGFNNMFLKILDEQKPTHICVFFDEGGPTFRHEQFKAYKETRKPTPDALKVQIPLLRECLELMGVLVHSRSGYEADDEIAATALGLTGKDADVVILTADKDMLQVLQEGIEILRPIKGVSQFRLFSTGSFEEEYGFAPRLMADYLALVGDTADNVPGVRGIGDKGAKKLLAAHGGLEGIYENLDSLPAGTRKKLEADREQAFLSLELTRLREDGVVPLEKMFFEGVMKEGFTSFCNRFGLTRLAEKFGSGLLTDRTEEVGRETALPETSHVSLDELLQQQRLALCFQVLDEGYRFGLAVEDGRIWEGEGAEVPHQVISWLSEGELLTWDYKSLCHLLPDVARIPEKVWDGRIGTYLLHPDRTPSSQSGEEEMSVGLQALRLFSKEAELEPGLKDLDDLMRRVDLPLCPVLADMESRGLGVDGSRLRELEESLRGRLETIEREIGIHAGETINLSSPKQVAELLFERLGLPPVKKTKTGFSTDVTVLEELARLPVPEAVVPRLLLEYREASKMSTGFVRPFLDLAGDASRACIHTTFEHTTTGTGRLSSRDPNIQNLPVFGQWAGELRSCFVPGEKGWVFVAADYSQIELRVLAHLCGDSRLREAFCEGRDIHQETAAWVFGVPAEDVTSELRRSAKVVNFGLLYGMSAFGLAQRMGIGRAEAGEIVDRYFSVFPGVRQFLEDSYNEARRLGYTQTLFGRRRPLDEVATVGGRGNGALKRVAINSPIQGTAADIAKMAMIAWERRSPEERYEGRLVLQVHDSLVCECPAENASQAAEVLKETMEGVVSLAVPLLAETKSGPTLRGV